VLEFVECGKESGNLVVAWTSSLARTAQSFEQSCRLPARRPTQRRDNTVDFSARGLERFVWDRRCYRFSVSRLLLTLAMHAGPVGAAHWSSTRARRIILSVRSDFVEAIQHVAARPQHPTTQRKDHEGSHLLISSWQHEQGVMGIFQNLITNRLPVSSCFVPCWFRCSRRSGRLAPLAESLDRGGENAD